MSYRTAFEHTVGVHHTTEFRLMTQRHPRGDLFADRATLGISTGAAHLQTYTTADDLRKLANAFLDAAQSLDEMATVVTLTVAEAA